MAHFVQKLESCKLRLLKCILHSIKCYKHRNLVRLMYKIIFLVVLVFATIRYKNFQFLIISKILKFFSQLWNFWLTFYTIYGSFLRNLESLNLKPIKCMLDSIRWYKHKNCVILMYKIIFLEVLVLRPPGTKIFNFELFWNFFKILNFFMFFWIYIYMMCLLSANT